ncbi:MAG TPA: hypothetical protein PLK12_17720, partial [Prolixibacteraceae bacterium]|nr:hypothetical protein [Prolixibacteraceae bacterium]
KKEVVQTNRQRVEELISAYEASTRWVNQYPDSAAALIVQYDILPDSVLARGSVPRSNLHFVRAKEIQQQIEDYLNVFYAMDPDIIGGKLPDEDFIYK